MKSNKRELEEIKEVTETPTNQESYLFKIEETEPLRRQVGFKM
jgi:hypothetical protein